MQPFQRAKSFNLKHTSTRRTSGHCLGTFKTGEKMFLAPTPFKCNVSRYLPHFHSSLSLSFSLFISVSP
jgi:hypothetical protein